jgi:hypothetical protein
LAEQELEDKVILAEAEVMITIPRVVAVALVALDREEHQMDMVMAVQERHLQ